MTNHIDVCEAWFESSGNSSRIIVATRRSQVPQEFWVPFSGEHFVHFKYIDDLKGRKLFESTLQHWEYAEGPSVPSPLFLLLGPHQIVSQDRF